VADMPEKKSPAMSGGMPGGMPPGADMY